jgi:hypothetical protein
MTRSYHVTRKAARVARANGDAEPAEHASAKSWVKKTEKMTRSARKHVPQEEQERSRNRDIVSRAKRRHLRRRKVKFKAIEIIRRHSAHDHAA